MTGTGVELAFNDARVCGRPGAVCAFVATFHRVIGADIRCGYGAGHLAYFGAGACA